MNGQVQALGSFWESTAPYVEIARQDALKAENRRRVNGYNPIENRENNRFYENDEIDNKVSMEDMLNEIKPILKKAGISMKDFPFVPNMDKEGNVLGFIPKGKNEKEIKENIKEYKAKMEDALQNGKITQEEYDKLEENLDELMKENEIELDEEKEMEVSDKEIMDNIKQFIMHNYGNRDAFEDECKNYEEMELEDRKFKLQDINSKINTQLGIVGDLKFSSNPNLKFENSFFDKGNGGYYLTEKEVAEKGLGPALYTMMEKSMMRQLEQKQEQKLSPEQKKKMHEKILKEKKQREEQKKRQEEQIDKKRAKQYIRNMYS